MPYCAACGESLPAVGRFCPACGAPVEAKAPTEERKLATVLFADLVGSTELAGAQDPERTRALLDRFYEAMAAEIEAAGGTVEKFAGDAVMAAFGAPAAHEDDAERALHAALAMQRRLRELFGGRLALRIGVNTGEVVVGRAREGSSFVSGDTVNVAARLEQAAAPDEIVVGERTATAVRGAFEFDVPATVEAKGKPGGVACRRLVRALSLMRPRGVGSLRRVFVGRERELDLLESAYHAVARGGEAHLVTLVGDAGVGKTRLVRELWGRLGAESPEPLRRTGRCLSYGKGITYLPLAEALKEHFGLLESDPPETLLGRLAGREILGLTFGLDVAGDLHPLVARDRLYEAWVRFLEELSAERPTVLLVEDLHWAEEPLLDLLEHLVRNVRGPFLLLATARPELFDFRPGWSGREPRSTTIALEPLSAQDAGRMLDELLATDLPAALRDILVERAEGNPFFVEELIGTLIDQGVLARTDVGWIAGRMPAGFVVPDSVHAVLAARIDLLGPAEKAALQAASVIGRVFWAGPVYELVEGAEPRFRVLEERDFVRRRTTSSMLGEHEFVIKHALTREVAYGTLPKAKRARLHAAFAAWLEQAGGGRDEHAPLLAHHYVEAVTAEGADLAWAGDEDNLARLRATAAGWLRRAADLAVARYAIDEALVLLHRALGLEASEPAQAEVWRAIGRANALQFDGEAFWTAMQEAIGLSTDPRAIAELYSDLALETAGRPGMWKRRPAPELVEGWVGRALELSEPGSPARARALAAQAYWQRSREVAREARALAERLGRSELVDEAEGAWIDADLTTGEYDEALDLAMRRVEALDEPADPDKRAGAHWHALMANLGLGRIESARRHAALHDAISSELTPHHVVHGVGMLLHVHELAAGWEAIRELVPRAERVVADNVATPCTLNARSLLVCALASAHAGDAREARRLEDEADALGMEGYGLTVDAPRVQLALLRRDLETVERLVAESSEAMYFVHLAGAVARLDALVALGDRERIEAEAPRLVRPGTYLEPFALRALGTVREDESLVEQAAARFEAMGLDRHAAETRALLA